MKILIIASHNSGKFSPFVTEQAETIKKYGYDYPQIADQKFGRILGNAYLCTKFEIPL